MTYKSPILLEVFVEIHYKKGTLSEDKFFELVPKLKVDGYTKVEINQIPDLNTLIIGDSQNLIQPVEIPRIKCWDSNKINLVQISPDFIAVNNVRQYTKWADFKNKFDAVLRTVNTVVDSSQIYSVNFTTIDELTIPQPEFLVGKYLKCGGKIVPAWYADTNTAFDMTIGKGFLNIDGYNRQIRIKARKKSGSMVVRIESAFHDLVGTSIIDDVLTKLQNESDDSFEDMITEETRSKIMGGKI